VAFTVHTNQMTVKGVHEMKVKFDNKWQNL